MKQFLYRMVCTIALFILIPVVFTFLIQGSGEDSIQNMEFLPSTETAGDTGLDEGILPGILANEISMNTETEAIKAQAVIVRTNCLLAVERGESLPEGLTKGEMIRLWGQDSFSEYYSLLESCVEDTKGVAMVCGGTYIRADFHRCSAGYTRNASEVYENEEFPYLKSVDGRMDLTSEDFLKVIFYTPQQLVEKGGELFSEETRAAASSLTAADLLGKIVINQRDQAGYVTEIAVDGAVHSGEEIRLLYGWNSSAFSLKEVDGEIRVLSKGLGHGLGASLYGANQLAKDGFSYKDILKYFYSEIEFVTRYD